MNNESTVIKDDGAYSVQANLQPTHAEAITAGVTVYDPFTLYVGTAGNVTVTTASGQTGVQFTNLANGSILPVLIVAVTSATASGLVLMR